MKRAISKMNNGYGSTVNVKHINKYQYKPLGNIPLH